MTDIDDVDSSAGTADGGDEEKHTVTVGDAAERRLDPKPSAAKASLNALKATLARNKAVSSSQKAAVGIAVAGSGYADNVLKPYTAESWDISKASAPGDALMTYTTSNLFLPACEAAAVNPDNVHAALSAYGRTDMDGRGAARVAVFLQPALELKAYHDHAVPITCEKVDNVSMDIGASNSSYLMAPRTIRVTGEKVGNEMSRYAGYVMKTAAADGSAVDFIEKLGEVYGMMKVEVRGLTYITTLGDDEELRIQNVGVNPKDVPQLIRNSVFSGAQAGENHMPLLMNMAHHIHAAVQQQMMLTRLQDDGGSLEVRWHSDTPVSERIQRVHAKSLILGHERGYIPVAGTWMTKQQAGVMAALIAPVSRVARLVRTHSGIMAPLANRYNIQVEQTLGSPTYKPKYRLVMRSNQAAIEDLELIDQAIELVCDPQLLYSTARAYAEHMCLGPQLEDAIQTVSKMLSAYDMADLKTGHDTSIAVRGGAPVHVLDWTPFALREPQAIYTTFQPPQYSIGMAELVVGGAVLAYCDNAMFANLSVAYGTKAEVSGRFGGVEMARGLFRALMSGTAAGNKERYLGLLKSWYPSGAGRFAHYWDPINAVHLEPGLVSTWQNFDDYVGPLVFGCKPMADTFAGALPKSGDIPSYTKIVTRAAMESDSFLVVCDLFELNMDAEDRSEEAPRNRYLGDLASLMYHSHDWVNASMCKMAECKFKVYASNKRHFERAPFGYHIDARAPSAFDGFWAAAPARGGRSHEVREAPDAEAPSVAVPKGEGGDGARRVSASGELGRSKPSASSSGPSLRFSTRDPIAEEEQLRMYDEPRPSLEPSEPQPKQYDEGAGAAKSGKDWTDVGRSTRVKAAKKLGPSSKDKIRITHMSGVGDVERAVANEDKLSPLSWQSQVSDEEWRFSSVDHTTSGGLTTAQLLMDLYNLTVATGDSSQTDDEWGARLGECLKTVKTDIYLPIVRVNGLDAVVDALIATLAQQRMPRAERFVQLVKTALAVDDHAWAFVLEWDPEDQEASPWDLDEDGRSAWAVKKVCNSTFAYSCSTPPLLRSSGTGWRREVAVPLLVVPAVNTGKDKSQQGAGTYDKEYALPAWDNDGTARWREQMWQQAQKFGDGPQAVNEYREAEQMCDRFARKLYDGATVVVRSSMNGAPKVQLAVLPPLQSLDELRHSGEPVGRYVGAAFDAIAEYEQDRRQGSMGGEEGLAQLAQTMATLFGQAYTQLDKRKRVDPALQLVYIGASLMEYVKIGKGNVRVEMPIRMAQGWGEATDSKMPESSPAQWQLVEAHAGAVQAYRDRASKVEMTHADIAKRVNKWVGGHDTGEAGAKLRKLLMSKTPTRRTPEQHKADADLMAAHKEKKGGRK